MSPAHNTLFLVIICALSFFPAKWVLHLSSKKKFTDKQINMRVTIFSTTLFVTFLTLTLLDIL